MWLNINYLYQSGTMSKFLKLFCQAHVIWLAASTLFQFNYSLRSRKNALKCKLIRIVIKLFLKKSEV